MDTRCMAANLRIATAVAVFAFSGSLAFAAESYSLTFAGDASFNGAHGGQPIAAAVVAPDSGEVVARQSGTVSSDDSPAFSLSFPDALTAGERYEVHYWIDSNFGGGSEGGCDPKNQDHQWRVELGTVDGDVTHTEQHNPGATADVCETFADM
ncbi:hypothetical protein [Arhodomonas sp. AD133]|uniref:hypothetical protein n=1 Tax=Arhodomonas sp. AD133 TaxID=3415009 RepID=UPI003EB8CBAA